MIKRFTELDWNQYNGSERFVDGSEPLIFHTERYGVSIDLIGDGRGIELDIWGGEDRAEDDFDVWYEEITTTPAKMRNIMERIIKAYNLDGDWYAPDISYGLDHGDKMLNI